MGQMLIQLHGQGSGLRKERKYKKKDGDGDGGYQMGNMYILYIQYLASI